MNTEQAKKISIISYLKSCGIEPKRNAPGKAYYLSPFRSENEASFKVDLNKNVWFDYGTGKGGNIIDLCILLNNTNVSGVLKILSNQDYTIIPQFLSFHKQNDIDDSIKIKHIQELQNRALIQYSESRKIPFNIARTYLKEVYYSVAVTKFENVEIPDKKYFSLCFKNDKGGYEFRNSLFKNCVSPKTYTTILGKNHNSLNIFEGFFDFLSALTYFSIAIPSNDTIVLNSTGFTDAIIPLLKNYASINLYLDNDTAGIKSTKTIIENHNNVKNHSVILFPSYNDFNEFLCSK